jgi:hypothetical protein
MDQWSSGAVEQRSRGVMDQRRGAEEQWSSGAVESGAVELVFVVLLGELL